MSSTAVCSDPSHPISKPGKCSTISYLYYLRSDVTLYTPPSHSFNQSAAKKYESSFSIVIYNNVYVRKSSWCIFYSKICHENWLTFLIIVNCVLAGLSPYGSSGWYVWRKGQDYKQLAYQLHQPRVLFRLIGHSVTSYKHEYPHVH